MRGQLGRELERLSMNKVELVGVAEDADAVDSQGIGLSEDWWLLQWEGEEEEREELRPAYISSIRLEERGCEGQERKGIWTKGKEQHGRI